VIADCLFCRALTASDLLAGNDLAGAFAAGFPVSRGHTLIVPRRHEADFFALTGDEQAALVALVNPVRAALGERYGPDAFNLGVNAGKAAGQTILHAHLHVIPRYAGDVAEPRGGVRWVLPETARYW
jgi:diadenosine tetraphosphate (Ap4A) HIT family hydrolase